MGVLVGPQRAAARRPTGRRTGSGAAEIGREQQAILIASAAFIGLLAACEATARLTKVTPEISRKMAHISCGVLAAFLPRFMTFTSVIVVAVLFVPFMLVSRSIGIFPSIHSVERSTLGEIYFPLGVGLAAAVFPRAVPYGYGVLVMALSDAFASLVGGRWPGRTYSVFKAHKSVIGSSVFFDSALALTIGALAISGQLSAASIAPAVGVALALTLLEGVLAGGVDNAVLPVAGAGLLVLILSL